MIIGWLRRYALGWAVIGTILTFTFCVWMVISSGILLLFRSGPSVDALHLRGKMLELTGQDAVAVGQRLSLTDLPPPVLVCSFNQRAGTWVAGALKKALAKSSLKPQVLIVLAPGTSMPVEWYAGLGLPARYVQIDDSTATAWGFNDERSQIRLVGADHAIVSVDLAANRDRDLTVTGIITALSDLPPTL